MADTEASRPSLMVCTTCRARAPLPEDGTPPGQLLYEALERALAAHPAPPVTLRPTQCFAACDHGCVAAIAAPGKWSYLLGPLDPAMAEDLLAYGTAYAAHASGALMPSRRPESLRGVVLARLPALEPATTPVRQEPSP
jgi:predicted metal-binding protein